MIKPYYLICVGILIISCSSVPNLPTTTKSLLTQESNNQYYYCESCPIPTKLSKEFYKPLEPDVIPVENQENKIVIINNESSTNVIRKHVKKHKKYIKHKIKTHYKSQPKQCLKWSN